MKNFFAKLTAIGLLFFLICLSGNPTFGASQSTLSQVKQLALSTFGSDYFVGGYEVMDSLVTEGTVRDINYTPFVDPYGTVKNCVIFWVKKHPPFPSYTNPNPAGNDTSIICIMKDGRLKWHSPPIIGDVVHLIFCYDLNKGGMVDLGFWVDELWKGDFDLLYLVSWDGTEGKFISDVDQSGQSVIIAVAGLFDAIDIEGNGKYVIRSEWADSAETGNWFPENPSPTAPFVTYGWNGSKYGYWPSVPQIPGDKPLPANRIKLIPHCNVTYGNGIFKYSYGFTSDNSSQQLIGDIYIENIDSAATTGFGPWYGTYSWILNSYYWYSMNPDTTRMIKAGEEQTGFGFLSSEPPVIKNIYGQGDAPPETSSGDEIPHDKMINDVLDNSYSTRTIGPGPIAGQLSISAYLDTLISYKHQSITLGWLPSPSGKEDKDHGHDCDDIMNGKDWCIQGDFRQYGRWKPDNSWDFDRDWNNGIVEVLDARLNKAKAELSKKDSVDARQDLEIFVMEVEMLNDASTKIVTRKQAPIMTSEAYALLKYNAEYLIDRLPEKDGKGDEGDHGGKK